MKKRIVVICLLLVVGGIAFLRKPGTQMPSPTGTCSTDIVCPECNVILITVDSLRADRISALGYGRKTTPNIDRLMERGIVFPNYFSNAFLTPITQMSVHTGMYPSSNGMTLFNSIIPNDVQTMAQLLNGHAWRTSALHTAPEYAREPGTQISFSRGFGWYRFLEDRMLSPFTVQYIQDELDFIKAKKFFLWLTVGSVHFPYGNGAPDVFSDKQYSGPLKNQMLRWDLMTHIYDSKIYPNPVSLEMMDISNPGPEDALLAKVNASKEPFTLSEADIRYIKDMYDNGILHFDAFFQKLVDMLNKANLMDKTIIVITSEHGDDHHEHKFFAHHDIYDTLVHTPLLIYSPRMKERKTVNTVMSSVDILPTLFTMLGLPIPKQVQGRSFVPFICGAPDDELSAAFIERIPIWEQVVYENHSDVRNVQLLKSLGDRDDYVDIAIRTKKWKYILRRSNSILKQVSWWITITGKNPVLPEEELYDMEKDPYEQTNVVQLYPEVKNDLRGRLLNWWETTILPSKKKGGKTFRLQEYF